MVYLHYGGAEFKQEAFLKELHAIDPTARTTGVDLVSAQLSGAVKESFAGAFLVGRFTGAGCFCLFTLMRRPAFLLPVPGRCGYGLHGGNHGADRHGLNFMNAMVLVTNPGHGKRFRRLYIRFPCSPPASPEGRRDPTVNRQGVVFLSAMTTIGRFRLTGV